MKYIDLETFRIEWIMKKENYHSVHHHASCIIGHNLFLQQEIIRAFFKIVPKLYEVQRKEKSFENYILTSSDLSPIQVAWKELGRQV